MKISECGDQQYQCARVGCFSTFRHKTQLYRHRKKCTAMSPAKKKTYGKKDHFFHCVNCGKKYQFQSGVIRHTKSGCTSKKARSLVHASFVTKPSNINHFYSATKRHMIMISLSHLFLHQTITKNQQKTQTQIFSP